MATLFELYATLGLDTTDFKEQADAAVKDGQSVADQVSDAFDGVDTAAEEADKALDDVQKKSSLTEAVMNGFASATEDLVSEAIQGIIELGKESLEIASQSGTAMAEEYLRAQERLAVSSEAMKLKIGNLLLPAATVFSNIASDLMGISDSDRLLVMLDQLESYSFENFQRLSESLNSVFGQFEQVEYGEGMNVEDMTAALDSQIEYWNQYNRTLAALQNRDVDTAFLASIADGTMQSFETLKALEAADAEQLDAIVRSFETLENVRESTAAGLNGMQNVVDENFIAMVQSVGELVAGMDQSEAAYANALLTGNAVADALNDAYPTIVDLVEAINETLAQIGNVSGLGEIVPGVPMLKLPPAEILKGLSPIPGFASGLPYVPYDDYDATLHRGEAVLTRQQAEEYRSGRGGSVDVDALAAAVGAALNGAAVVMDGHAVGQLVTGTVSRQIAREAKANRRYGG